MTEKTIFEMSKPGRRGVRFPASDVPQADLPKEFLRAELPLPEMPENEVVRHFTRISQLNHAVDIGFYPLGSCTMKYNPKINEETARLAGFSQIHPLQPVETVQGALGLMHETQEWLAEISGF
ncbi:MAG: aminomethyl-transferring glycine dehydrogenase subunit GcvPB, partial [Anaerolineales bacterium]